MEQTELFEENKVYDELDVYSKKRISVHKVAIYENGSREVKRYDYHMVIVDLTMTINITLSEQSIINMLNSVR